MTLDRKPLSVNALHLIPRARCKAQAALDALARHDFVYVHVEATDEAGHEKNLELKIRCIEYLDERITRTILAGIEAAGYEARVAVLPDHPTPVETGDHA